MLVRMKPNYGTLCSAVSLCPIGLGITFVGSEKVFTHLEQFGGLSVSLSLARLAIFRSNTLSGLLL